MSWRPTFAFEFRTWLLLAVSLIPAAVVLVGATWLWFDRSESISLVERTDIPAMATYNEFVATSAVLQTNAGFIASALPGASPDLIRSARADGRIATELLETLVEGMPADVEDSQKRLVELSRMANDALDPERASREISAQVTDLTAVFRESSQSQAAMFQGRQSVYFDALVAIIDYHHYVDMARSQFLEAVATDDNLKAIAALTASTERERAWDTLVEQRSLSPRVAAALRQSTSPSLSEDRGTVLSISGDPVPRLLRQIDLPLSNLQRNELILELQALDDALLSDAAATYQLFVEASKQEISDLRVARDFGLIVAVLVGVFSIALSWLIAAEIRRRRRIERAHAAALERLEKQVDRDPTTGAWNRRRLERTLPKVLESARRKNRSVLLAYLDLDSFKAVNDVWGHAVGDAVLRTASARMLDFRFDGVEFELCRFGGDEFVLHAETEARSIEWLEELGRTITARVGAEMLVNGRLHKVGISAGIAASSPESTIDSLLLEADSALILAKGERGTAMVYDRSKSRTGELVQALPRALSGREVKAHIQPVIDVRDGSIVHVEALARWHRPSGESVSPGEFIPIVESFGLAEAMTTTMLESIGAILTDTQIPDDVRVWVNVSPHELVVANFAHRFHAGLTRLGISSTRIGIEITETAAIRDHERLAIELERLQRAGIKVAIDDFGNGYSPLGYLRNLPVDTVKIDRSLVTRIDSDIANQHIVVGIVGLVRELGMEITAEGVERIEEMDWLVEHGVARMQGFLFGRPGSPNLFDWNGFRCPPMVSRVRPNGQPLIRSC